MRAINLLLWLISPLICFSQNNDLTTYPNNSINDKFVKEKLIGLSLLELQELGYGIEPQEGPVSNSGFMSSQADCNATYIPVDPGTYTAVPRNDDGSLYIGDIGFNFSFCGIDYSDVYINTNGNLTFGQAVGQFSPNGFPYNVPMVAPFWADVDTRNVSCGQAWYRIFPNYMIVSWEEVGWYSNQCTPLNTFQVIISDGTAPIIGVGNNIQFRYGDMNWTTGQASGGGPFGGIASTVGYNSGDNVNYEQIGRFNVDDSSYDGPEGADDGVHWLDNKCFVFDSGVATIALNCMDITRSLDGNCTTSITAEDVAEANSGCSTVSMSLDISTFDCTNAGPNTVTITASNGAQTLTCTAIVTITTENCPVTAIDPAGPYCESDPPSTLTATPGGGTWGGASTGGTFDPGALGPGLHNVTYSNPNACPPTTDIFIEVYPSPEVAIGPDPAEFCEEIGFVELEATGSGGTAGYTYDWTTPIGPASGTILIATDPGDYTVTITDVNGCTSEQTVDVIMNLTPFPVVSDPGDICESEPFVILEASPAGGIWTGASNEFGEVFPGDLGVGTHTVFYTYTDQFGCSGDDQIDINIVEDPIAIPSNNGPYCEGDWIELFGDTNINGPATFVWSGPGGYSSFDQNPLDATEPGIYYLEVIANGCTSLPELTEVVVSPAPLADAFNNGPYCEGDFIELFSISDSGMDISYQWSGPGGYVSFQQNPTDATEGGLYSVLIIVDGCPAEEASTLVELTPQPIAIAANGGPYCLDGIIELYGETGNGTNITYSWSGPGGYFSNEQNPTDATEPGNYILTVIVDGCESPSETTIVIINEIQAPVITGEELFCEGLSSTLDAGSGYSSYQWSNGTFNQTTEVVSSGTYTVIVGDLAGCTSEASFVVNVTPNPIPDITGSDSFCNGSSTLLDAGADYLTYIWSTGDQTQTIDAGIEGTYSVTVTDMNGCTGETQIDIFENQALSPDIFGELNFCQDDFTVLDGAGNYDTYLWSDGTTDPTLVVTIPGNYGLTVTDASGCTGEVSVDVVENELPNVVIIGNAAICEGENSTLDAGGPYDSYIWSDGSTSQTTDVITTGTYGVTVVDVNGCINETTFDVEVSPLPVPIIVGPLSFCTGNSVTLDAGGGYSTYSWSDGSSGQTIEVASGDIVSVTVTDGNGCTGEDQVEIIENESLSPAIDGELSFCQNDFTILDGGIGYETYLWSDGTTDPTLNVIAPGNYSLTVSDINGCTGETSVDVVENGLPNVAITGNAAICEGENSILDAGGPYGSYIWSDGSTSQTIDVITAGTYGVTVADINGCINETTFDVEVNPLPVPIIVGPLSFCTGNSVTLDAGGGYDTYTWSDGSSGQTIEIASGETVSVTVTDASGCTGEDEVEVIENESLTPIVDGELQFCENDFTVLDAGTGYLTYSWSDGSTSQQIDVDAPGGYTVTVSDANGCTGETTVNIIQNDLPTVAISGNVAFCESENSMLDAGGPFETYLWSDGSASQTIMVDATGTYSVTVTTAAGCENETSINVNVNPLPEPIITGPAEFCAGSSVTLDAGGVYDNYEWSDGTDAQTIDVATGNTYTVTVTDGNGCTGEAVFEVIENESLNPAITGVLGFCEGEISTLDAGTYTTYEWSDGSAGQTLEVNTTGAYSVTVTDDNGCTGETQVDVTVNELPVVAINGDEVFCEGENSMLDAGGPYDDYLWSDGSEEQMLEVGATGSYSVTVTNADGCTNETSFNVMTTPNPEPVIAGSTTFCEGSSATLDAGNYEDYLWSDGSGDQTLTVNVGATYSVTVTDVNGCTGVAQSTITESSSLNPVISGDLEFCVGANTILDAGAGFETYTWSDGSETQTLDVVAAGEFSVTVTDATGCTGETTVSVLVNDLPSVNIAGNLPFCSGENITLDAGDFETYLWSDESLNQILEVSTGGIYSVTVTDVNGCTNETTVDVIENQNPEPNIFGATAFCSGGEVQLDAGLYDTYLWSDGNETQIISVSTGGTYIVTVTNANGCSGETQITVTENDSLEPQISGPQSYCEGTSIELSASPGFTYDWSNGESTQTITVTTPGIYEVLVSDASGCTGITQVEITENQLPEPQIAGSTSFCIGTSTTLDAGAGYAAYIWSDASLNQTLEVTTEGTYSVTVTTNEGCTAEAFVDITQSTSLSPVIVGDLDLCDGEASVLDAGLGFETYIWSNGAVTQSIDVSTTGSYSVTVSDASGCTGETTADLTISPNPTISIEGVSSFCDGDTPTLDAGPGYATYLWSDGSVTQTILATATDTYSVTVTNANDCTAEATIDVIQNTNPIIEILGPNSFCSGNSVELSLNEIYETYTWSNGEITESVTMSTGGMLSVTVTDVNGCTGEAMTTVTENSSLTPQITGVLEFCESFNTTLDAGAGFETYTWTTGETSQTITVAAAGDYGVLVTDLDGCSGTSETTVAVLPNPEPIIAGSTTFCSGNTTTLDAGGYASYLWSDGSTESTLTTNTPGEYIVTVTTTAGCVGQASVMVEESTSLNPVISGPDSFCEGGNTILDAGAGFNTYDWSDGTSDQTLTTNVPGDYSVTVSDAGGCTGETLVSVELVLPPGADLLPGATICNTEAGGSMLNLYDLIAAGDMTGTWDDVDNSGALGTSDNLNFDLLTAGDYIFEYTTNTAVSPCVDITYAAIITVEDCSCPGVSFFNPDPICNSDGLVDLSTVVNSTETGTWSIQTVPTGTNPATLNGELFDGSGADAGEYILEYVLTNGQPAGCPNIFTQSIIIDESVSAGTAAIPTQWCADESQTITLNDQITAADLGGVWTETSVDQSQGGAFDAAIGTFNMDGQLPGVYTFAYEVTGALVCPSDIEEVTVVVNELPIAVAGTGVELDCTNTTLSLNATGSSAGPDFEIVWDGPEVILDGNENTLSPNVGAAGSYQLTITNTATGCSATDAVEVTESADVPVALGGSDQELTCIVGVVTLQPGDPYGPDYLIEWTGPDITPANMNELNPEVATAGTYTLTVTYLPNGCISSPDIVEVIDNTDDPTVVTDVPLTSIDCNVEAIDLIGSSPDPNVTFEWTDANGVVIGTTPIVTGVDQEGIYYLTVTNTLTGCDAVESVTIVNNVSYPNADAGLPQLIDCNNTVAILDGSASQQGADIIYTWSGPGIIGSNVGTTVEADAPGLYTILIENTSNGCSTESTVLVSQDMVTPQVNIATPEQLDCVIDEVSLDGSASSSGANYSYQWQDANGNDLGATASIVVGNTGAYYLYVQDANNGCVDSALIVVTEDENVPQAALIDVSSPNCFGQSNGTIIINEIEGGTAPYVYSIDGSDYTGTTFYAGMEAGTYEIALEDAAGCEWSTTIEINEPPALELDLGFDLDLVWGDSTSVVATTNIPQSQIDTVIWTPADQLTCADANCTEVGLKPNNSFGLSAMLIDVNGCEIRDDLVVFLEKERKVYIPNAFSPNGDLINDIFMIYGDDPTIERINFMRIFNRWGEVVYDLSNLQPNVETDGWDGTLHGEKLNPAVFVYIVEIQFIDGHVEMYKGDVTLMK